jgi:hypothetical protein
MRGPLRCGRRSPRDCPARQCLIRCARRSSPRDRCPRLRPPRVPARSSPDRASRCRRRLRPPSRRPPRRKRRVPDLRLRNRVQRLRGHPFPNSHPLHRPAFRFAPRYGPVSPDSPRRALWCLRIRPWWPACSKLAMHRERRPRRLDRECLRASRHRFPDSPFIADPFAPVSR